MGTLPVSPLAIRLDRVSAQFQHRVKGAIAAVHEVSLEVRPGELLTLLGPSGCGKTTTLRMIAGFQEPTAGRIFIGDRDVTGTEANDRGIGFVFQNYALFPHLSVFENVAYGLRVQRREAPRLRAPWARFYQWSALLVTSRSCRISSRAASSSGWRWPAPSSSGPACYCSTNRSPIWTRSCGCRCAERSASLQKTLGITTVYVTHDQEEAMAISDRIAVMNKGEIVPERHGEELYYRPASEFVAHFIGHANLLEGRVVTAGEVEIEGVGGLAIRPRRRRAGRGLWCGRK